jgi:Family of unknown function (DUF5681)
MAENTAGKQRGRPWPRGTSGNPDGKPRGARHRATLAAEALLDGEAEALTRKCVELALSGDMTAMRLCMDRLLPPRRERPVAFRLPRMTTAADATKAAGALVTAVAAGALTPGEAADLGRLIQAFTDALEAREVEQRLAALEAQAAEGRSW